MEIKKRLKIFRRDIDMALNDLLPKASEEPKIIHRAMRYSVFSGGKRIRPILAIEACIACGGKVRDVMPAACAIELVHTYSLIHDDLPAMDNDDYRRGKPTCHRKFGEANAILTGDALLTLAFEIISAKAHGEKAVVMIKELARASGASGMVGGQVFDLLYEKSQKTVRHLNMINRLKTGKLFEASTMLGAIAAGADKREVGSMAEFGLNLGLEFQLVDDILDRDGYVKLLGDKKARIECMRYNIAAKRALSIFGNNAANLVELTDLISGRRA